MFQNVDNSLELCSERRTNTQQAGDRSCMDSTGPVPHDDSMRSKRSNWHLLCHNAAVTSVSGNFLCASRGDVFCVVAAAPRGGVGNVQSSAFRRSVASRRCLTQECAREIFRRRAGKGRCRVLPPEIALRKLDTPD